MKEVIRIHKRLQKFGLSEKQAELYVFLLRQGNVRISDIVKALELPRSSVYETLKGLFDLGLAEEIIENSYKVIHAYPIESIRHQLVERMRELEQQTNELEGLEKALQVLPAIPAPVAAIIRYYKGRAGARQLFWNTLKAKNTLYVQSEWGRGRYVGIDFYKSFVAESYARNVQEKVLANASPRVLDSIRQHTGTPISRADPGRIRCVAEDVVLFKGETLMYDNIYAHIFLKNEEISGFEIESQQFVDTQRAIFEILWAQAKPLSELL